MENKKIDNLWSEDFFNFEKKNLPFTILEQQAIYFNTMSRGTLVAEATSQSINVKQTSFRIVQSLRIIAPKLDNYYFDLIKLYQDEISPYPLQLDSPFFDEEEKRYMSDEHNYIHNDNQLLDAIKDFLNRKLVKEVIQNLMLQSEKRMTDEFNL